MPSPFPGMDPYLEGYLWCDLQQSFAVKISQLLAPRLRPRYVARLNVAVVSDQPSDDEISIMYPDVEVVRARRANLPPKRDASSIIATPTLDAPLTIPLIQTRITTVEVRDVVHNELVTLIELLSPVNKREPGFSKYLAKRAELHAADVHLLEIDLLRRGTRPIVASQLRDVPYLIALTRALASQIEIWPLRLQDALPTVPVPLRAPDPAVPLELSLALATIYDEAAYDLSIDYHQTPPPPPLSSQDAEWLNSQIIKSRSE